jgi:nitroreductase
MQMKELIRKTRSYRRFRQDPISVQILRELLDMARLTASQRNCQPLRYILSCDDETNAKIFPATMWAAALKEWGGPVDGEKPTAYIVILGDKTITEAFSPDEGIAAQSILLGAMEKGIGGCMLGALNRKMLFEVLNIPHQYKILLVIALGTPGEEVVIEDLTEGGTTAYYRDEDDVHHVPKRKLDDIIVSF